jgi:hypothetical protein
MICTVMEAGKGVQYRSAALAGAAQLRASVNSSSVGIKHCTQTTLITQTTHGNQGQYSWVPMPSLFVLFEHPASKENTWVILWDKVGRFFYSDW